MLQVALKENKVLYLHLPWNPAWPGGRMDVHVVACWTGCWALDPGDEEDDDDSHSSPFVWGGWGGCQETGQINDMQSVSRHIEHTTCWAGMSSVGHTVIRHSVIRHSLRVFVEVLRSDVNVTLSVNFALLTAIDTFFSNFKNLSTPKKEISQFGNKIQVSKFPWKYCIIFSPLVETSRQNF